MQRLNSNVRLIFKLAVRYALVWVGDAVSIAVTALVLPGIYFLRDSSLWYLHPFTVALLFGLLNALLRPILILLLLPITFVTLGLATLGLNAALFYLMNVIVGSFVIESFGAAVIGVLVLTLVNTFLGNFIQAGDDYSFYATLMNKFGALTRPKAAELHDRGLVVLQIDGLSYHALKTAIRRGKMPYLSDMLKRKQYAIRKWFSGLPSQTSAVQAGIFYGDSYDIPGFRWYDKRAKRLVTSSNSSDLSALDERLGAQGQSILKDGTSIITLIHGGANKKLLTVSSLGDKDIKQHIGELEDFAIFSLHPYLYTRTMFQMMWDFLVDRFQAGLDWARQRKPRLKRGIKFSFHRAIGNTLFRELCTFFIQEDIVRGVPVIYGNYLGYDMVAHYGGPSSMDALSTLTGIDRQIKKINRMITKKAPKHFDLVILSDHGQTPCVPFTGLYGQSLRQLVEEILKRPLVEQTGQTAELGYFNALLREIRIVERAYGTKPIRRGRRTLERLQEKIQEDVTEERQDDEVVVCASGNLAHVYFTETTGRMTTEDLLKTHPNLLENIVSHEGIGFVITTNVEGEHLMMGKQGMRKLRSGVIEGVDPLIPYAHGDKLDVIAQTLLNLSSYPSSGDLVINGRMLRDGSVVSFENQRGTHGGLGGDQTEPFIIYPRVFRNRQDQVQNPTEIHSFLKKLTVD